MRQVLFLVSGLLLTGCATPEEQAAYLATTYGQQCTERGFPAGSTAYQQCVTRLDLQQRQNYDLLLRNNYNAMQPRTHCFRVNNTLQCG